MFKPALPLMAGKRRDVVSAPLARPFWLGVVLLIVVLLLTAHPQNLESAAGGVMIIVAACLPCAIWTLKQMGGLPLFPVFAMTHVWAFGFPLLYEHPIVIHFPAERQLIAAISVTGFLLLATLVWHQMRRRTPTPPRRFLTVESRTAEPVFLIVLAAGILFTIAGNGLWLRSIPPGVFTILRAVVMALEALSCFVLSYRLGNRELGFGEALLFKVLFVGLLIVGLPSLYLITPISLMAIAVLGYVSASGKVPWIALVVTALSIAFLHAGKADMRDRYWGEAAQESIQPWEYPAFFAEWTASSVDGLFGNIPDEDEESSSVVERSSLMHLLLYEQLMSPDHIPFMWGQTYVTVPQLLIPRILYPDKPEAHAGTHLLNIHYGLQTEEQSEHTTVGFGLLNESYANFGFIGMALLAIVLGGFYGSVERQALLVPLLSFRGLFAVIVASYAFQDEFAAGVWLSALFQSMVAFMAFSFFLMKVQTLRATRSPGTPLPTAMRPTPA